MIKYVDNQTGETKEISRISGFQLNNLSTKNVCSDLFSDFIDAALDNEEKSEKVVQYRSCKDLSSCEKKPVSFLLKNKIGKKRVVIRKQHFTLPFGYDQMLLRLAKESYKN